MLRRVSVLILSMMVVFMSLAAAADKLPVIYVLSKKADIMTAPDLKSKVVVTLVKGSEMQLLEKQDMWYKVKAGDNSGWVSKYLVTETNPASQKKAAESMKINMNKEARKRASSSSTAASALGLEGAAAVTGAVKADLAAVKKMEEYQVPTKDVDKFIEEGKLK